VPICFCLVISPRFSTHAPTLRNSAISAHSAETANPVTRRRFFKNIQDIPCGATKDVVTYRKKIAQNCVLFNKMTICENKAASMLKIQDAYLTFLTAVQQLISGTLLKTGALACLEHDIRHTEFLVPVIGEYSAGKSSLLNAFLGGEVLPVGLKPVTELATELRYGSDPHLLALRPDGSSERLDTGAIATIKLRAHEFTHLQLYLDHPRLQAQPSLVLVDMPGFGSSLASHEKALAYYLPRGVHFIVVVSAEAGNLTQSLMRRLDDIHTYGRGFSFVLNKTNLRADEEVDAVAGLVETQIQMSFAGTHPLIRAGRDGGERLVELLARLDPEQIARGLFEERMKDETHTLLNQLNAAMSAARKASAENESALLAMAQGIEQIERKPGSWPYGGHVHRRGGAGARLRTGRTRRCRPFRRPRRIRANRCRGHPYNDGPCD
jgi:GTP-binding protein EngB required for normal cell division